jgi:hypothetical protein
MSEYDGCYIKLAYDPTFYAVDDGKKKLVESPEHMNEIGLRKVFKVSEDELDAIPFAQGNDEEE